MDNVELVVVCGIVSDTTRPFTHFRDSNGILTDSKLLGRLNCGKVGLERVQRIDSVLLGLVSMLGICGACQREKNHTVYVRRMDESSVTDMCSLYLLICLFEEQDLYLKPQ